MGVGPAELSDIRRAAAREAVQHQARSLGVYQDFKKRIDENCYVPPKKVKLFPELAEHWVQKKVALFLSNPKEALDPITIRGYQRQAKVRSEIIGTVPCDELDLDIIETGYTRLSLPKDQGGYAISEPGRFKTAMSQILRHGMKYQLGVRQDYTLLMDRAKKKKVHRSTAKKCSTAKV